MTPSALLVTSLADLASGALGAAILLAIGRAQFRHRNSYGQLVFRSYGRWLVFRGATALLRPLGVLLLLWGGAAARRAERTVRRLACQHPCRTGRLEGSGT